MISRLHAAVLAAFLCAAAAPAWADFAHAKETYTAGQFEAALAELKPLAEKGDAKAQELLGRMYMKGQGTAADKAQARNWLSRAADQGNSEAGRELGYMTAKEVDWETTMSSPANRDALIDSDGKLVAYRIHGLALPIPHGYEGPQLAPANVSSGGMVRFYKKNVNDGVTLMMTLAVSPKVSEYVNLKDDAANKEAAKKGLASMVDILVKANPAFRTGQQEEITIADKAAFRLWFSTKSGSNVPDRGWLYYLVQNGRFYYLRIDQINQPRPNPSPSPNPQEPARDDQSDQSVTDTAIGPVIDYTGDATGAFEAATFQPEEEYGR